MVVVLATEVKSTSELYKMIDMKLAIIVYISVSVLLAT